MREAGRLPIRSIQWYLRTVHQLRRSVGAIESAIHQTAQQTQPAVAGMVDRIRASPVVHADETGRVSPADGEAVISLVAWSPRDRSFLRQNRNLFAHGETGVNSDGTVVVTDPRDGREHSYKLPELQDLGEILKMRFTAG